MQNPMELPALSRYLPVRLRRVALHLRLPACQSPRLYLLQTFLPQPLCSKYPHRRHPETRTRTARCRNCRSAYHTHRCSGTSARSCRTCRSGRHRRPFDSPTQCLDSVGGHTGLQSSAHRAPREVSASRGLLLLPSGRLPPALGDGRGTLRGTWPRTHPCPDPRTRTARPILRRQAEEVRRAKRHKGGYHDRPARRHRCIGPVRRPNTRPHRIHRNDKSSTSLRTKSRTPRRKDTWVQAMVSFPAFKR